MIKSGWSLFLGLFLFFGLFVNASAAALTGYAWSENIGWIKFSGPGYGVDYDKVAGQFSGYGWSENIGWIKLIPRKMPAPAPERPTPTVPAGPRRRPAAGMAG